MTVTEVLPASGDAAPPGQRRTQMQVRKRDGASEPVDVNKIVRAVERWADDLADVDPLRVATRTISGLYDGATTAELDRLSIQTAAEMIGEEPQYSRLAARLLAGYVDKEVRRQGITSFSAAIRMSHAEGLIGDDTAAFVAAHARTLDDAVDAGGDRRFEYFGLRTVYDRYLLRHPTSRLVLETPQYWLLRVACGLSDTPDEAVEFYRLMSSLAYLPSSPTLFNSGTRHTQMSSCYLVDSPRDELDSIYQRYAQVANLSKFAGGIGIGYSRVRSRGSLIRGTNGQSNGIVPWLRTLDASVAAVNQGGRRKGAACVYLEPWHPDIEEFLQLRDNTGEDARRTHNLNLANWIPDEFMRRVEADEMWSLFDPHEVPELPDLWGAVRRRVPGGRGAGPLRAAGPGAGAVRQDDAHPGPDRQRVDDLQGRLEPAVQPDRRTGQRGAPVQPLHRDHRGVQRRRDRRVQPRLGEPRRPPRRRRHRLGAAACHGPYRRHVPRPGHRHQLLPDPAGGGEQPRWRPVGLGLMGLQDVFFALRLPFDSPAARELSTRISEELYLTALETSADLARRFGAHPAYGQTRAARGQLQPDLWGVEGTQTARWDALRERIAAHGLRNSLLVAVAPTATIASIAGCYECIEPQVSNLFKRETLSGEFLQVNTALVRELKARGLWTGRVRSAIKRAEGSVQDVAELPASVRELFRTAWELPQRALIDLAAARAPFIDQSQSLNLFLASPTIGKLSSMYLYAWKAGLKTTYYLRSRPATRIQQATVAVVAPLTTDAEALACSLENPESCEACQ
ncbi:hypothetical protein GCM10027614_19370 [Micromonospora vulcania]